MRDEKPIVPRYLDFSPYKILDSGKRFAMRGGLNLANGTSRIDTTFSRLTN